MHKAIKYNWLLFFIYPAAALVVSFSNYKSASAKNILWAFVVFFGFTFAIGKESSDSDINRYIDQYVALYGKPMTTQDAILYYEKSREVDVIRPFLAIVLSRISNHPALLTTVYALIFGFFYSRNIFYLINQFQGKISNWTWLLVIVFTLIVPFWTINGFRFWTATHIFIYGLMPFLLEGNKKRLIFVLIPVLFHFSFVIPLFSVVAFFFIPKRLWLFVLIFVATVVYNEINVQWLANYVQLTEEEKVIDRTSAYIDDKKVEEFRSGELKKSTPNWYVGLYRKGINYLVIISFVLIYWLNFKKRILNKGLFITFSFALWFYSFANVLSTIPSGGRFLTVAQLIAFVLIIVFFQNSYRKLFQQFVFPVFLPAILLFIIVAIRDGFYYMSVSTVLGNPISALMAMGQHLSLNDVIK
ncbi:MAG: EpsG family protein [Cyclobacteriaceae bacterium]|nr:EpsG family protein [Cyclobacteriaceae bacterium]